MNKNIDNKAVERIVNAPDMIVGEKAHNMKVGFFKYTSATKAARNAAAAFEAGLKVEVFPVDMDVDGVWWYVKAWHPSYK